MENLVGMIKKAGKAQRTVEFLCPYTKEFYVDITWASKVILMTIRDASVEVFFNTKTRDREERLNDDKLRNEYVDQIVRGWRGLTPRELKKLLPGFTCEEENLDDDVPFEREIALVLMEYSVDFESWIIDTATLTENYTTVEEKKNKEFENLEK